MAAIGVIKGNQVGKNRDGDKTVRILQVELIEGEDVRSIELFTDSDFNPANGTRIFILDASSSYQIGVCVSDGLTPEVLPGEKEIYSTDNPVTAKKARAKFGADGIITLNQGTDFAVAYNDLKIAFDQLKLDFNTLVGVFNSNVAVFNAHIHPLDLPLVITKVPATTESSGVVSTADMSPSKVATVKLP